MILSIKASISSSLASSRSWSASSNPQFCEGAWRLMRSYLEGNGARHMPQNFKANETFTIS